MKIAFTGHRPEKLGAQYNGDDPVTTRFRLIITSYLECRRSVEKDLTVISGMALGVDTWAAKAAIATGLPFIAAVPFEGQEAKWPKAAQAMYQALLSQAKKIVVVSPGGYASWKFQKRNEWLVDNCDELAAVWDGKPGSGTSNCVNYAVKKGRPIERLEW